MSEKKLLGPVPSAMNNIKTMLTQHGAHNGDEGPCSAKTPSQLMLLDF